MSEQQIRVGKIIVLATWLFAAASFFFPFYYWPTGPLMRGVFGILLAVHFVEFLVYLKTFRQTDDPMFRHFAATITYGILHYTIVKQKLEASQSEPTTS